MVQCCEHRSPLSWDNSQVPNWTVKTFIATIFPKIGDSLNYSAREHPPPLPFLSTTNNSCIVFAIFLLETAQTALSCADLFYWFISGFDNPAHLTSPYMGPFDVPIIASVVSLVVQFFYAYRIWILSAKQSGWFCLLICLVSRSRASLRIILECFLPRSSPPLTQQRHSLAAFM